MKDDSPATEQASLWLERLERTLRKDEVALLREWLGTPLHRELIIERCKLWHGPEILAVLDKLIPGDIAISNLPPRRRRMRFIVAWTLAICLVALSTFLLLGGTQWFAVRGREHVVRVEGHYRTPLGGRQSLNLPGGTMITMNTASSVFVNYGARLRMMALSRGEVMFDIPPDTSRPFQLTACGRAIEAERGRFNVRRLARDRCEITVMAGAVRILQPRFSARRTPAQLRDLLHYTYGEATLLAADGGGFSPGWQSISKLTEAQAQARVAWQQGLIIFADEPLANALAEVARYVSREIVIADDSLREVRLSGRFHTGDLDSVLLVLRETLQIESRLDVQGRIVLRAAKS